MVVGWCPLCPQIIHKNMGALKAHLKTTHLMNSSAHILARIIVLAPNGRDEALQILKDVQDVENRLQHVKGKAQLCNHNCSECSTKETHAEPTAASGQMYNQDSSYNHDHSESKSNDPSCQTDADQDCVIIPCDYDNTINISEFQELKINIEERNSDKILRLVREKDSEIFRLHQKIANLDTKAKEKDNDVEELEIQLSRKCKEKIVLEKDFNKYKENKRVSDIQIKNLERGVQELVDQLSKKREEKRILDNDFKKYKDYCSGIISEKDEKISELTSKSKNLNKEVERLKVELLKQCQETINIKIDFSKYKEHNIEILSEKDEKISNMDSKTNDLEEDVKELEVQFLNKWEEKTLVAQDFNKCKDCSNRNISDKDQKIANLDIKAMNLDIDTMELHAKFSTLEQDFKILKKHSQEEITDKDQKIENLEIKAKNLEKEKIFLKKDIKKYKGLSDAIISKYKAQYDKTLADMNSKLMRHREILSLMKESVTDMAAMHEDTSDKLIEAVNNSSETSKVVGNDLVCRFLELEKVVGKFSQDKKDFIPKISIRKDIFRNDTFDVSEKVDCQFDGPSCLDVQSLGNSDETDGKERRKISKRKLID